MAGWLGFAFTDSLPLGLCVFLFHSFSRYNKLSVSVRWNFFIIVYWLDVLAVATNDLDKSQWRLNSGCQTDSLLV